MRRVFFSLETCGKSDFQVIITCCCSCSGQVWKSSVLGLHSTGEVTSRGLSEKTKTLGDVDPPQIIITSKPLTSLSGKHEEQFIKPALYLRAKRIVCGPKIIKNNCMKSVVRRPVLACVLIAGSHFWP